MAKLSANTEGSSSRRNTRSAKNVTAKNSAGTTAPATDVTSAPTSVRPQKYSTESRPPDQGRAEVSMAPVQSSCPIVTRIHTAIARDVVSGG